MRGIAVLIGAVGALYLAGCSHPEAPRLYIDHALDRPLDIRVVIDEAVMFEGVAEPTQQMPPLILLQRLDLAPGRHVLRFEDRTRGIIEVKTFDAPATRTLLVRTRADAVTDKHLEVSEEVIPIK
jgi:hypothetical protein